jgi:hypothetical protein
MTTGDLDRPLTPAEEEEARRLELLLAEARGVGDPAGEDAAVELHRLRGRLGVRGELEGTAAFLARARELLAEEPEHAAEDADAVASRVLAESTRSDVSVRGDLRLVRDFVTDSLRSSRVLRILAASLLVHLIALPVVAWYVLGREDASGTVVTFEAPSETFPFGDEPGAPAAAEPLAEPLDPVDARAARPRRGPDPDAVDNTLRRERLLLTRVGGPETPPAAGGAPAPLRMLELRARGLNERTWAPALDQTARVAQLDGLTRVLWVETLLDRYALKGTRSPALIPLVERMLPGGGTSLDDLEQHAVLRAGSYGLLDEALWVRWAEPLERSARRRTGEEVPIDGAWLARLGRALGEARVSGAQADAWLRWEPTWR